MLCSGCGKTIPFNGNVCPHCQRDKSRDQQYTVWSFILGIGIGYLGYRIFGGWGGIIGFVIGCAIAFFASGAGKSNPPEVSVVTEKLPSDSTSKTEDRLRKLSELRQNGLIDESEYIAKRKTILDEL